MESRVPGSTQILRTDSSSALRPLETLPPTSALRRRGLATLPENRLFREAIVPCCLLTGPRGRV
jgi:hypothetical protein